MELTLTRFLNLSINFSKVGSLTLEDTYSLDVVFDRTPVGNMKLGLLTIWVAIVAATVEKRVVRDRRVRRIIERDRSGRGDGGQYLTASDF